jgi:amino acid transporter
MNVMTDQLTAAMEAMPEVEVKRHYPFGWFDVGAVGTGEMILNVEWVFMVFIVSIYGLGFSLLALGLTFLIMLGMYYIYRDMISAIPEPGWMQSYGREAGHAIKQKFFFSIGSALFISYVVVFAAFLWGEVHVLTALGEQLVPAVPSWLWAPIMILPMTGINLLGHQITAKVQTILVTAVIAIDILFAVALFFYAKSDVLAANWSMPAGTSADFTSLLTAASYWLAIYVGYEIAIVVLDEWKDVNKGIRIGIPFALLGVLGTYLVMLFAIMGTTDIKTALGFAIPHIGAVQAHFPTWAYVIILCFALIASHTSINIFFMACGKQLAMYSQQGALPRIFSAYSRRGAVPWFSICFLSAVTIAGAYVTTNQFILAAMATFATTYYFVMPIFYLLLTRNQNLPRPSKSRFGVPVAILISVTCAIMFYYTVVADWQAAVFWVAIVAVIALYDFFVVPHTPRGRLYREELLRPRETAGTVI